ncbi:hypothetical protein [Deinococcus sp.]
MLEPVIGFSPVRVDDEERAAQFGRVREAFEALDGRATVFG